MYGEVPASENLLEIESVLECQNPSVTCKNKSIEPLQLRYGQCVPDVIIPLIEWSNEFLTD